MFLFIDFEKAFDSPEWKFLLETLEATNFGSNVTKLFAIYPPNSANFGTIADKAKNFKIPERKIYVLFTSFYQFESFRLA